MNCTRNIQRVQEAYAPVVQLVQEAYGVKHRIEHCWLLQFLNIALQESCTRDAPREIQTCDAPAGIRQIYGMHLLHLRGWENTPETHH